MAWVELLSGPCTVRNGTCMLSPNFPGLYGPRVDCHFLAASTGQLMVNSFEVEMEATCAYDYFRIDASCVRRQPRSLGDAS